MKYLSIISIVCVSTILIGTSCKKQVTESSITDGASNDSRNIRKVQFVLYTDKDLSGDNHTIIFKLSIQKPPNQVLWDSTLAPMRIKDIPDLAHKLIVKKAVPGNDPSLLKVGFSYSIQDVGNSWYFNAFNAGDMFKVVNFNFQ